MTNFSESLRIPTRPDLQVVDPEQLINDMCTGIERATELGFAANFFVRRGADEGFRKSLAGALAYTARIEDDLISQETPIPNELSEPDKAIFERLMRGYQVLGSGAISADVVTEAWHDQYAADWKGKTVAIWRPSETLTDVPPASYRIKNTTGEEVSGQLGLDRAFTGTIVDLGIKHHGAILLARGYEQIYEEVSVDGAPELEARASNRTQFNTADLRNLFQLNHAALPNAIEFIPSFSIEEIENVYDTSHPEYR
jgi:hypothetical protein